MVTIEEISARDNIQTGLVLTSSRTPGLLESIFSAYGNLTLSPFALSLFILCTLSIFAEQNDVDGPFEIISNALKDYISDTTNPAILRTVASIFSGVISFVLLYKERVFNVILVFATSLVYPNSINFISIVLMTGFLLVSTNPVFQNFLVVQLFFVYFNMPNNLDRFIIFILIVVFCFGTKSLGLMLSINPTIKND